MSPAAALLALAALAGSVAAEKLLLAQAIWRHGNRNPGFLIPKYDGVTAESFDTGLTHETYLGLIHGRLLGTLFKQRYITETGLLNPVYKAEAQDELGVRSSEVPRTVRTALAMLSGLYDPDKRSDIPEQFWDENLRWLPVPVFTQSNKATPMIASHLVSCKNYDKELLRVLSENQRIVDLQKKNQHLLDLLTKETGSPATGLLGNTGLNNILAVFDPFIVLNEQGRASDFPPYFNYSMFESVSEYYDAMYDMMYSTPFLAKIKIGNVLDDMAGRIERKLNGSEKTKFFGYSGHDFTVAPLLDVFKLNPHGAPGYTATTVVELWEKDDGNKVVRMFYRPGPKEALTDTQYTVPDCDNDCPVDTWLKYVADYRLPLDQFDKVCDN